MNDHDLLVRIDERVERIDERIDSHAKRIRTLERFRSWCIGGFGTLSAMIGAIKFWH